MDGGKNTEISAHIKKSDKAGNIQNIFESTESKLPNHDQKCGVSGDNDCESKKDNQVAECKVNKAVANKQEASSNPNEANNGDGKPDKGRYTRAIDGKSVKEARKARKNKKHYKQLAGCQGSDDAKTTAEDQNNQMPAETGETPAEEVATTSGGYSEMYEYHIYNATKYKDGKNKKFDGKNRNGKGGARKTVSFKKLVDIFEMTEGWQVYVCTSNLKTEEDQANRRISQRNY